MAIVISNVMHRVAKDVFLSYEQLNRADALLNLLIIK